MTIATSGHSLPVEKPAYREWVWYLLLGATVILLWCAAYNRWSAEAWGTPIVYSGDARQVMGIAKTFASGEVKPFLPKYPASLGAPFVADWNDYPPADGLFAWYGLLARLFGILAGSNLVVLSAHLLAAASFYFVAQILGYRRELCFAGAILFSMSHFAFLRNLAHVGPLFYWHVPLGLLVAWWCGGSSLILKNRRKVFFCIAVGLLYGIHDPYYSAIFLQFLVLASLVCFLRREQWPRILFPLLIACIVLATHALMAINVYYARFLHGPNPGAFVRAYAGLENYALKPLDLLLPFPHRIGEIQAWVQKAYVSKALFVGELGSPYLGIVAIVALASLIWVTARAVVNRDAGLVPLHFWGILWILVYSVVGGLNGLIGIFGIILFRGTNRYSIIILALLLLFGVRQLTLLARKWHWLAVTVLAAAVSLIGFWDQSPRPPSLADISKDRAQVLSDGEIASTLEAKLPARAMIFEMPATGYPEVGPTREMEDYEHFRPYLQSNSLRFSYGSVKGRNRERWQEEAVRLGPAHLVKTLELYGFSAVLINRKAYEAKGAALLDGISAAGRSEVLCQSDDLVCIRLSPVANPLLPPAFDRNWFELEGDATDNWRWSQGDASIAFFNQSPETKKVAVSFSLTSSGSRTIQVSSAGQEFLADSFSEDSSPRPVRLTVNIPPGGAEVHFRTNAPGKVPGNGDQRKLAFMIRNFTIEQ